MKPPGFDPKDLPKWAEEFSQFILLTSHLHADVKTKCVLIQKLYKTKFLQQQVKTAIRICPNLGDFLKRLEQMYSVYETDLSVCTDIEDLQYSSNFPQLPVFLSSWRTLSS